MTTKKQNYRISIYLGKELWEELASIAKALGLPISTAAKIIMKTGFDLSKVLNNKFFQGLEGGKKNE